MKSTAMLLAAAAAAVGVGASADAQTAKSAYQATAAHRPGVPPVPNGGATVLFDTLGNATTSGALSAQFSSSSGAPYDSEGADDFVVPAAGWDVSLLQVAAFSGAGATEPYPVQANVRFYADEEGVPGATACEYLAAAVDYDEKLSIAAVQLPETCSLPEGTYWVSYQPIYDYGLSGDDYYWNLADPQTGAQGKWRNPLDGFESGCTDWGDNTACGFDFPDYAFRLSGTEGSEPEDEIFADGFELPPP